MAKYVLRFAGTEGAIDKGKHGKRSLRSLCGQYLATSNPTGYYATPDIDDAYLFEDGAVPGTIRHPQGVPPYLVKVTVKLVRTNG